MKDLKDYVISIPDFPEKGIIFRDVTGFLQEADGISQSVDKLQSFIENEEFDIIAGAESRGFIFGMPLAYNLKKPFALVRKAGKLPRETVSATYELEYGSATIEMHKDSIHPGDKVVLVDDLLATGGTMEAAAHLIEELGGEVVKMIFVIELAGLKGREKLAKYNVESALIYEGK